MTGDEFRDRYQILKRLTAGEISTFLARSRAGDRVMVHVLRTPPEATRDLLARVARLTGSRDRRVREVTRHRGTDVVVTDFLEEFESLEAWLPGLETAREGRAGEETPERSPSEDAGDFTRLFEAPAAGEGDRGAGGEAGSETDREEPGDDRPGEFTRLFEVDQEGEGSRESPAEGRDESERPEPGEGGERPEDVPPGRETADTASEAGEGPPGERVSDRSEVEPRETGGEPVADGEDDRGAGPADADAPGRGPGEFTRLFEAHGPDAGSPEEREAAGRDAPPGRPGRPAEGRGGAEPSPEASSSSPSGETDDSGEGSAPPPGDPGAEGQPGEFTRMFGSQSGSQGATEEETAPAGDRPEVGADGEDGDATSPAEEPGVGRPGAEPPESAEEPATGAGSAGRAGQAGRDDPGGEDGSVADEGPGEFTRMFGSPDTPSDDLPASTASGGRGPGGSASGAEGSDDYLERLGDAGGSRTGSAGPDPAGGAGAGPPEDGGEEGGGPGRYTRMIERPSAGSGASDEGASEPTTGRTGGSPFDPAPTAEGETEPESGKESGSRTVYLAALGGVLLVAVVLVIVLLLVAGGGEEGSEPDAGGDEPAATTETSALPGEHDEQLQLGVREIGRHVDGEVPRLTDGGPVLA